MGRKITVERQKLIDLQAIAKVRKRDRIKKIKIGLAEILQEQPKKSKWGDIRDWIGGAWR